MASQGTRLQSRLSVVSVILALGLAACTPAAQPSPTVAPAQPAPTTAAAKPESKAAPTSAPAEQAAKPAAKPAYDEKAVADFYKDKTFKIIVGLGAGGGFDTIYRIWGRHASKYIPGNPTIIVENMTGAGGLIAANHLYNAAPKDGTVMGTMDLFIAVLGQIAGAPGIEFDARNFSWIGNPGESSPSVCAIRSDLGFNSYADLLKSDKEIVLGASGKGNVFYATPRVLQEATGAKIKVIDGYNGNPAVRLAVENGELDGACWQWGSMKTAAANWFEGNPPMMKVILQAGSKPYPDLPDVELLRDYIKDPQLMKMADVLEKSVFHVYLSAMPPGVPADRLAAVRDAWLKTWADPEVQQEVAKTSFNFQPVSGEETAKVVNELLDLSEEEGQRIGKVFGLID